MSSDLVWILTRSNSSFLVKRNNVIFSREPGNLTNKHSLKSSGLAPSKTVAIVPSAKGVTVSVKKQRVPAAKVAKSLQSSTISKPSRTTAKKVKAIVAHYRPDLVKAAVARAGKLLKAQKPANVSQVKKGRSSRK